VLIIPYGSFFFGFMQTRGTARGYWDAFLRTLTRWWNVVLGYSNDLSRRLNLTRNQTFGLLAVVGALAGMAYYGVWPLRRGRIRETVTEFGQPKEVDLSIFSPSELLQYDGSVAGRPLYLGILGEVYDVTAGAKHYGGHTKYAALLGADASAAFATGRFTRDVLKKDLSTAEDNELSELFAWRDFFQTQRKYPKVGLLVDRYYNGLGWPTSHLRYLEALGEKARTWRERFTASHQHYEPCSATTTTGPTYHIYCPDGKLLRELVVLRHDGREARRCVCVRERQLLDDGLAVAPECAPAANRCERHK